MSVRMVTNEQLALAEDAERLRTENETLRRERDEAREEARTVNTGLGQLREIAVALSSPDLLLCGLCGKPATCFGTYERPDAWAFSCGDCCGHGCEDGQCYPLTRLGAALALPPGDALRALVTEAVFAAWDHVDASGPRELVERLLGKAGE